MITAPVPPEAGLKPLIVGASGAADTDTAGIMDADATDTNNASSTNKSFFTNFRTAKVILFPSKNYKSSGVAKP